MMKNNPQQPKPERPTVYQIMVRGRLDASWSEWFDGMAIATRPDKDGKTVTTMTGAVVDQVALHGLLARIRDLGLPLLSVERREGGAE